VGLLGRIFGKVQRAPQPPRGLEDRANFTVTPGSMGTDAAYQFEGGIPSYTNPVSDGYFPTIADQTALLTNYYEPPDDQNPDAWYQDKDRWGMQQQKFQKLTGVPWEDNTLTPILMDDDPRWVPPPVQRPTAFLSPSSYRFTRPFDQNTEHDFNGVHLSLAENRRAYILTGTVGQADNWNNTYRVDPLSNDSQAVFVGDTVTNNVSTAVLYEQSRSDTFANGYRLS
jgi:hypothetical protein